MGCAHSSTQVDQQHHPEDDLRRGKQAGTTTSTLSSSTVPVSISATSNNEARASDHAGGGSTKASAEKVGTVVPCLLGQAEDPSTLPFTLPATLDDITADWLTALLRYRGVISGDTAVSRLEKKGVGATAGYFSSIAKCTCTYSTDVAEDTPTNFVAKTWPALELMPPEKIATMFKNDIDGYTQFKDGEFYSRPTLYLGAAVPEENKFVLVMRDATDTCIHMSHETNLTLEQTKSMIPLMAQTAARFENCHEESHPMYKGTSSLQLWTSRDNLGPYRDADGEPLRTGAKNQEELAAKGWDKYVAVKPARPCFEHELEGFHVLFAKVFDKFWADIAPENGGSVTYAHGDLRGDNFFHKKDGSGWMAIDFQLAFKGPIPSDLAYLMSSGTVLPEVYEDGLDEILHFFYDEFQKHTKAYTTASGYSFQKFEKEFSRMAVGQLTAGLMAFTEPYFQSAKVDGRIDPAQPDKVLGPLCSAPELGKLGLTEDDLSPKDLRDRLWAAKNFPNRASLARHYGGMAALETLLEDGKE